MLRMPGRSPWLRLLLLLLALALDASAHFTPGNVTLVGEVFPKLKNLRAPPRNPHVGGQSFDQCCLFAVNKSLQVVDGSVVQGEHSFVNVSSILLPESQFPCGAEYEPDKDGAPEVRVPYRWCAQNCPGWELSHIRNEKQWIIPLIGFIIPAVVFCLTVPRRVKLSVLDRLFDIDLRRVCQLPVLPLVIVAAGAWVTLDTVIWVAATFAFAGPMLLSGLYEGHLDQRLLSFVEQRLDNPRVSAYVKGQVLFAVLVGNLDLEPALEHMREMLAPLDHPLDPGYVHAVQNVKVRLRSMLSCQYSFGSMTGAPVIFYTAAFIYAVVDVQQSLGDVDTSNALAFGIWWMTVPHVAIVGACLLAGNNPTILEGIVGQMGHVVAEQEPDPLTLSDRENTMHRFLPKQVPVYQSLYRPASMWDRGRRKREWINKICDMYEDQLSGLRDECRMKLVDWIAVTAGALFLALSPAALAFTQNYFTPLIGVGCRALTVLLYAFLQFILTILWIWDLHSLESPRSGGGGGGGGGGGAAPLVGSTTSARRRRRVWPALVFAVPTILVAVGGTMMQIMGVYRNCLCKLNISHWARKDADVLLSSNSRLHIEAAGDTWFPIGIAATTFLAMVAYIGWWYQRHLRFQFRRLVDGFDYNSDLEAMMRRRSRHRRKCSDHSAIDEDEDENENESEAERPLVLSSSGVGGGGGGGACASSTEVGNPSTEFIPLYPISRDASDAHLVAPEVLRPP